MDEWSFCILFDVGRDLFEPVLKVKRKGFQCQLCMVHTTGGGDVSPGLLVYSSALRPV